MRAARRSPSSACWTGIASGSKAGSAANWRKPRATTRSAPTRCSGPPSRWWSRMPGRTSVLPTIRWSPASRSCASTPGCRCVPRRAARWVRSACATPCRVGSPSRSWTNSARSRKRRLGRGFALLLAMFLGVIGLACWEDQRFSSSEQWVAHTAQVIQTVEHVILRVQAAESRQRGYSSTWQEDFLAPYQAAVDTLPGQLAAVGRLVSDNSIQAQRGEQFAAAGCRRARPTVHERPGPPGDGSGQHARRRDDRRGERPAAPAYRRARRGTARQGPHARDRRGDLPRPAGRRLRVHPPRAAPPPGARRFAGAGQRGPCQRGGRTPPRPGTPERAARRRPRGRRERFHRGGRPASARPPGRAGATGRVSGTHPGARGHQRRARTLRVRQSSTRRSLRHRTGRVAGQATTRTGCPPQSPPTCSPPMPG